MGLLDRKQPKQVELEKKITTLRSAGMISSAERLEKQLNYLLNRNGQEKIKPMSPKQLASQVKEQKALGQKA